MSNEKPLRKIPEKPLNTRLIEALAYARMTQVELACILGESPQTINNWIKRGVSGSRMYDVAIALGVRVEWLRDGVGSKSIEGISMSTSIEKRLQNRLFTTDEELMAEALTKINNQATQIRAYQQLLVELFNNEGTLDSLSDELRLKFVNVINRMSI